MSDPTYRSDYNAEQQPYTITPGVEIPPAPTYYPPQPPKKSRKALWITLGVIAGVLVLCMVGGLALIGGTAATVEKQSASRMNDVEVTSCRENSIGMIEIGYTITNSSNVKQTYALDFDIMSSGIKVGDGFDFTEVAAHGTAKGETVASLTGTSSDATCVLVDA